MVTRLGGERVIEVEARVVAATNRDLEAEISTKRFRQDLYYRLNVHTLDVPPLRERLSDVAELSKHFLSAICLRFGMREKTLAPQALDALMACDWKRNNVRELRNIIERMIIASDEDTIGLDHVPAEVRGSAPAGDAASGGTLRELKAESERQIIVSALERNDWHITNTARELGLADHASLLKIMRRHGLKQR